MSNDPDSEDESSTIPLSPRAAEAKGVRAVRFRRASLVTTLFTTKLPSAADVGKVKVADASQHAARRREKNWVGTSHGVTKAANSDDDDNEGQGEDPIAWLVGRSKSAGAPKPSPATITTTTTRFPSYTSSPGLPQYLLPMPGQGSGPGSSIQRASLAPPGVAYGLACGSTSRSASPLPGTPSPAAAAAAAAAVPYPGAAVPCSLAQLSASPWPVLPTIEQAGWLMPSAPPLSTCSTAASSPAHSCCSADTALPLLQWSARASYQGTEPPPAAPPRQSLTASCLLDPAPPSCPPSLAAGKGGKPGGLPPLQSPSVVVGHLPGRGGGAEPAARSSTTGQGPRQGRRSGTVPQEEGRGGEGSELRGPGWSESCTECLLDDQVSRALRALQQGHGGGGGLGFREGGVGWGGRSGDVSPSPSDTAPFLLSSAVAPGASSAGAGQGSAGQNATSPAAGLGDRGLAPEGLDRAFGMIRGPGLGGPLSRLGRVQQSVFAIREGRPTYQPAPSDPAGATQADALLKQTGRQAADAHDSVLQQLLALQTDVRAGGTTAQGSTAAPGAGHHLPHQPSGQQVPTQQHQQQGGLQPSFPAATAPPLGQARGRRRSILLEASNSALQYMELIGGSAGPGPRSEGPRESQGNIPTSPGLDPESNGLVQLRPAGGARTRRSSIVIAPRECNASCGSGAATGAPFPLPSKYCSESATLAAAAGLLAAEGAAGGAVAPGSSMATDAEMEQLFARKPLGRSKSRRRSALLC